MDACLDYLRENGAEPALVIDPHTVVTAPWTTFKCQFGCENFGKNHCCPPEAPDYTRTRAVLDSFSTGILFRVHHWNATAMAAEGARRLFLDGYYKALAFGSGPCKLCPSCAPEGCRFPGKAVPATWGYRMMLGGPSLRLALPLLLLTGLCLGLCAWKLRRLRRD